MPCDKELNELQSPLKQLEDMCDAMKIILDPASKWYQDVQTQLRRLDYSIRWEMDRFEWELNFARAIQKEKRQARRREVARLKRLALKAQDICPNP